MAKHVTYHKHVDPEQEKNYHGTHHITKHYEQHNHRNPDHPDNHKNDHEKRHNNDHPREHQQHHGTHPEHRSHHSHNRVSNPNVVHHNAIHEHNAHTHTYIKDQHAKTNSAHQQNPNSPGKAPVTTKPSGRVKPGAKPVNPVTPGKPPIVAKSSTGTPGTKTSAVAPPHHGVNFGIGNPPTTTQGKQNAPGVYTPSVSDYSNSFAPSTANGTPSNATYNHPYNQRPWWDIRNAIDTVKTQWQDITAKPGTETAQQKQGDWTYQVGQWEYNTIKSWTPKPTTTTDQRYAKPSWYPSWLP